MLPEPRTTVGRSAFASLVAAPARAAVVLDYDGTLAPLVERPEDAVPAPGALAALARIADVVGHVAILSGRPAATLVGLAGIDPELSGRLEVLGLYGMQRWREGVLESPPPAPGIAIARQRLETIVAGAGAGVHVEDKGLSLAVHTRPAAHPQQALDALAPKLYQLADETGLSVVTGAFVLELRTPGPDKGGALADYVQRTGAGVVLYAGDDDGDIPVLDTAVGLRDRGVPVAIVCAERPGGPPALRDSADLVVDGPSGLVALLDALAASLGSG
ncbi:MAG TPA: trehalose-phosphatase [Mycobacteriales bacterium]|nr:trehalose-phosphatase [Mycobacteriales bacterium]